MTRCWKHEKQPAYMRIYTQQRQKMIDGVLPYGAKLPSKRSLADSEGVSVITVEHAYAILCDEGYIQARQRSGYFVVYRADGHFSAPAAPMAALRRNDHAVLPTDFPFPSLAKRMRRVLSEYGERILIKSPNAGCPELRGAIAAYLARSRGIVADPSCIIIGSGAEYLYGLCIQLLGRDRCVALENPCYDKIRRVYQASGARCELLKLDEDGIRSEELRRTTADILHVTPFHSFPSGITASASKRREYLLWARERDGYIVEDDFDSEFTLSGKAEDTLYALDDHGRVLYLNTFSKTVAPSIRAGYMVLPEGLVQAYRQTLGFYSCTVPVFEQLVLAELLNSGDFERHINRVRRQRRQQK